MGSVKREERKESGTEVCFVSRSREEDISLGKLAPSRLANSSLKRVHHLVIALIMKQKLSSSSSSFSSLYFPLAIFLLLFLGWRVEEFLPRCIFNRQFIGGEGKGYPFQKRWIYVARRVQGWNDANFRIESGRLADSSLLNAPGKCVFPRRNFCGG